MTNDMIAKFIESKANKGHTINIHFKQRETVKGIFIQINDYEELKAKNFWRVVSGERLTEWGRTKDNSLARLFSGMSFTRLSEHK